MYFLQTTLWIEAIHTTGSICYGEICKNRRILFFNDFVSKYLLFYQLKSLHKSTVVIYNEVKTKKPFAIANGFLELIGGFEPPTSSLPMTCSASWAISANRRKGLIWFPLAYYSKEIRACQYCFTENIHDIVWFSPVGRDTGAIPQNNHPS